MNDADVPGPQAPNARNLRYLHTEATRSWAKLCEHDEGRALGDAGTSVALAITERGWTVLAPGPVVLARSKDQLWAVGLRAGRPWGVPISTEQD